MSKLFWQARFILWLWAQDKEGYTFGFCASQSRAAHSCHRKISPMDAAEQWVENEL